MKDKILNKIKYQVDLLNKKKQMYDDLFNRGIIQKAEMLTINNLITSEYDFINEILMILSEDK